MTSGIRKSIRLSALVLGLALCSGAARAGAFDLHALGQILAGVRQSQAEFVETKTMGLLQRPLRLEGKLYFRAPDYVRKEVLKPDYEDYEIDGDVVRVQHGAEAARTVRLDEHPALRAFAEAFRATLGGDFRALQRYYDLRLQGTREDWNLLLTPLEPALAKQVDRIEVSGNGPALFSVLIVEPNGDQSLMRMRTLEQ